MSDESPVSLTALSDLCTPSCIRLAATLRIAEHLAHGIQDIDGLAGERGLEVSRARPEPIGFVVERRPVG
jgi:hypothetical protein